MIQMLRRAPVTFTLLLLIAIVFAVESVTYATTYATDDIDKLWRLGAIVPFEDLHGQYWRLLTGTFLHGGVVHWLLNSWSLFQLGSLYEALFGSKRFTVVYFVSGIAASVTSSIHSAGLAVGASGAIFGIAGAFIFSMLRSPRYRDERWAHGLVMQLIVVIAANLYIASHFKVIDNAAHIGGLVTGLLLGFIPHRVPPPPPREQIVEISPQPYDEGGF